MTVINPNSISGITSITLPSGGDNVLTIHTNDGTERFRIDSSGNVKVGSACTISQDGDVFFTGVCTATTLSGAASGLTGALPAIDGSALTGIAATDNVRTGILDVAGIATFRNTMNVGTAVTISESGIEATGVGITVANINGAQIGGRRNLVINGAMNVAQRGTSSTGTGYVTIDRFNTDYGGENEAPTYEQGDVASGTTPYTEGFRKTWKITNGNQTGGAGAGDYIFVRTKIEAQDLAKSGWDYTSSSSFITLSFWVKSSVAQTFYGRLESVDGTSRNFPYSYAVSANTWTKVVKTIPGNTSPTIQIDDNNGSGMELHWQVFRGTNFTDSGVSLDTWATYASGTRTPDATSTWWTTDDATWELTGVQLEVGSQATAFEHRSFGEELALCQRYYYRWTAGSTNRYVWMGQSYSTSTCFGIIKQLPVTMRAVPTSTVSGTFTPFGDDGSTNGHSSFSNTNIDQNNVDHIGTSGWGGASGVGGGGRAVVVTASGATDYIDASAEL